MRNIVFESKAFEQFNSWALENRRIYKKIIKLINNIQRTPYQGLGTLRQAQEPNLND